MASIEQAKPLRAAVVGVGRIAQQHLRALTEQNLADVAGVCDLSPATAACAAERYGIPNWFTDYERMLREVRPDVVHITTTPRAHYFLARMALEQGAHVIVEKPATMTFEELESLIEIAEARQKHLVEDYNYLFSGTVQRIVDLFQRGELGQIVHVDAQICLDLLGKGSAFTDRNVPHWTSLMPGNVVADFATHLAYLAHAFIGESSVASTLYRRSDPNGALPVDEFRATLSGTTGTANLSLSCYAQPDQFVVRVFGTRGQAEAHLFEPRFTSEIARPKMKPLAPLRNCLRVSSDSFRGGWRSLFRKLSGGAGSYDGLWELMRRFYSSLSQGRDLPVDHNRVRQVNRIVHDMLDQGPARGADR